jgi:glycosyltransferase involved in cell wall biosynthesis
MEIEKTFSDPVVDYEVIVVDDGSKDGTYLEVERAVAQNPRIRLIRQENGGKGAALKNGVSQTSGRLVSFIDADLDLHPYQLHLYMQIMQKTGADIVIGSKRHPDSKVIYPWKRKVLSRCYQCLIGVLFNLNVRDTQVGLKLFKREPIVRIMPKVLVKKYAFDLEVLVNATHLGYRIAEAPIDLNFQRFESRIQFRAIRDIFIDTMAVFYRLRVIKYYDSH